jgi:hypothetical protein
MIFFRGWRMIYGLLFTFPLCSTVVAHPYLHFNCVGVAMNNVANRPAWYDAKAYYALLHYDRALLMWEWLRRDPSYIIYHATLKRPDRDLKNDIDVIRAQSPRGGDNWGLHFYRGSSMWRRSGGNCLDGITKRSRNCLGCSAFEQQQRV